MPLPFSFFGSKPLQPAPASLVNEAASAIPVGLGNDINETMLLRVPGSPFPSNSLATSAGVSPLPSELGSVTFDSVPTVLLPELPSAVGSSQNERLENLKGLAGMVIRQTELQAPPLNRRSPFPSSPFSTLLTSPPQSVLATKVPVEIPELPLATKPASAENNSDLETLRQDLQGEIEQVKNDLFGAVMGVSALKDRLDGLEEQIHRVETTPPAAVPAPASRMELEPVIKSWLDDHLPAVIERMLADAQQRMLGTEGAAFFRSSVPLSEVERQSLFSQPPVILNSTPI